MTNLRDMRLQSRAEILDETLESAFPDVEPGVRPYGSRVLVQLKASARKTKGGLLIGDSDAITDEDNTQVAKVIRVGIGAYCDRAALKRWPEYDDMPQAGAFVRIPLYSNTANSWTVAHPTDKEMRVKFTLIDDLQIQGEQPDPFYIRAFL